VPPPPVAAPPLAPPPPGQVPASAGAQPDEQQDVDQQRLNITLVWILGFALLGLVFGIVFLSIQKETVTLPNGLTSLASLIGGGLLAFLNPVHGSRLTTPKNKGGAGANR